MNDFLLLLYLLIATMSGYVYISGLKFTRQEIWGNCL